MLSVRMFGGAGIAGEPRPGARTLAGRGRRRFFSYSTLALTLVFLLFIGMGAALHAYLNAVSWVDHSQRVQHAVARMMQGLTDAESAQRGYLLTMQEDYLGSYKSNQVLAQRALYDATKLTEDNLAQSQRVKRLSMLMNARLKEMDVVLRIGQVQGQGYAEKRLKNGEGLVLMNHIRALLSIFSEEEMALLQKRERQAHWLSGMLVFGLVSFALILGWFVWYGLRQMEAEKTAELAFRDSLAGALSEKDELLKQRELLLQEVNHRIKNSLNQIASMLRLQARGVTHEVAKDALNQALNRIAAIGRVHEQMYRSEQVGVVDARSFLQPLAVEIVESLLPVDAGKLELNIAQLSLPLEKAVPLTLMVNEMLTNAAKYARQPGKLCVISLNMQGVEHAGDSAQERALLTVRDNGPGLPKDMQAPERAKSLGMRLIGALARQLDGELVTRSTRKGTVYTLEFPLVSAKASVASSG